MSEKLTCPTCNGKKQFYNNLSESFWNCLRCNGEGVIPNPNYQKKEETVSKEVQS